MTTKVWISRTEPGASRSAAAWREAGFEPEVWPLLKVVLVASETAVPEDAVLVFTSANAVKYCGLVGDDRPVYAVGEATASALRGSGFTRICVGGGDVSSLVQAIEDTDKEVVHVSGQRVAGDLVGRLCARGMTARRHVVYRTEHIEGWPETLSPGDWVALYSPFASQTLVQTWPADMMQTLQFAAMSQAIAKPLAMEPSSAMRVVISDAPTEAALIEAVRFATTEPGS